jgi:hypothetical protein
MRRALAVAFVLFASSLLQLQAQELPGNSAPERLRKLEEAVRQLQQRNAQLESEVHNLKANRGPMSSILASPEKQMAPGNDNKAVFAAPTPPPVYAPAGGSEYKERKDFVTYYAGMFNGNGRNFNNNDNNEFMYVGRVELLPWKGKVMGQEASLKLGGDFYYGRDETGTNISPGVKLKGECRRVAHFLRPNESGRTPCHALGGKDETQSRRCSLCSC